MAACANPLLGVGIYSVAQASRLTAVSAGRIRRWLQGYRFVSGGAAHESPPVWQPQLPVIDGSLALSFRDLIEIRFVDAFLRHGVTWKTLRRAAEKARLLSGSPHPFSTRQFRTDGRAIFARIRNETGEAALLDVARDQRVFASIIRPYLKHVDFAKEDPIRWWPLGRSKHVVLDPTRSFGQPITADSGVPTVVLAEAYRANGSIGDVARWYEVSAASVRHAIEFEKRQTTLAAA